MGPYLTYPVDIENESCKKEDKKMIKESKEYSTSPYHEVIANYFDYEAFGRDISMNADGGFSTYGWVEKA